MVIFALTWYNSRNAGTSAQYGYSQMMEDLKEGDVSSVQISPSSTFPTGKISVTLKDGQRFSFNEINVENV